MILGSTGLATSFVVLSNVGVGDTYFAAVFGPMLLNGLSAGLLFMPMTATILADVEPEHAGAASGLLQTMQQLGAAIGVAVIVSVYAAGAVPGEFVPGARAAFLTAATFSTVALLVSVFVLRGRRPAPAEAPEPELDEALAAEAA